MLYYRNRCVYVAVYPCIADYFHTDTGKFKVFSTLIMSSLGVSVSVLMSDSGMGDLD